MNMSWRPLVVLVAFVVLLSSCTGTSEVAETPAPVASPTAAVTPETESEQREVPDDAMPIGLVDPPASLTNLVGTVYQDPLPELDAQLTGAIGGGAIINTDAVEMRKGLHYLVDGDQLRMGISTGIDRTAAGNAIWRLDSVWVLQLPPDSTISLGNNVCVAQEPTHEYGEELFFAMTTIEQDTALDAWIITVDGPVAYPDVADLTCERFTP